VVVDVVLVVTTLVEVELVVVVVLGG